MPLRPRMRPRRAAADLLLLVVVAACAPGNDSGQPAAAADATATCDAPVTPPLQSGSHIIGNRPPPVAYSSTPPTSGWHASGKVDVAVRTDDPYTEPEQVSVLEGGAVVVSYNGLGRDERRRLDELAGQYPQQIAVTPYAQLEPGEVALTGYGVLQRCDGLDVEAIRAFTATYATVDAEASHE